MSSHDAADSTLWATEAESQFGLYTFIVPKRPRSHVLEAESRLAFEALLNGWGWGFEPVTLDYGLDGRVEVFTSERASGLLFFVQLKATDTANLNQALAYAADVDHLQYWLTLDIPVLLVRYVATTRQLFVRWVTAFEEPRHLRQGQKSLTLHFSSDDELTPETGRERLLRSLYSFRQLTAPTLQFKLAIRVDIDADVPYRPELLAHLKIAMDSSVDFYAVRSDFLIRVRISANAILIEIPDIYQRTVPFPALPTLDVVPHLPYDALSLIGLALADFGHVREGGRIVLHLIHQARLPLSPSGFHWLTTVVSQARLWDESVAAARRCLDASDLDATQHVLACLLPLLHTASPDEKAHLIQELRNVVDSARRMDQRGVAAAMSFSLANILRSAGELGGALGALQDAAELDHTYPDRYNWQLELGRVSFLSGHFSAAAVAYQEAYRLLQDVPSLMEQAHHALLLAADALLLDGRYEQAGAAWTQLLTDHPYSSEEFYLKEWLADFLVRQGFTSQHRQVEASWEAVRTALALAADHADVPRLLEQGLQSDALNPEAWHLLAVVMSGQRNDAVPEFLLAAAVIDPDQLEGTVDALLMLVGGDLTPQQQFLATCVMAVGYIHHRENLRSALEERFAAAMPGLDFDLLHGMLDVVAHAHAEQSWPMQMLASPTGVTTAPWTRPPLTLDPGLANKRE